MTLDQRLLAALYLIDGGHQELAEELEIVRLRDADPPLIKMDPNGDGHGYVLTAAGVAELER